MVFDVIALPFTLRLPVTVHSLLNQSTSIFGLFLVIPSQHKWSHVSNRGNKGTSNMRMRPTNHRHMETDIVGVPERKYHLSEEFYSRVQRQDCISVDVTWYNQEVFVIIQDCFCILFCFGFSVAVCLFYVTPVWVTWSHWNEQKLHFVFLQYFLISIVLKAHQFTS